MFVILYTDARGDRRYLAADDTTVRAPRHAGRYDAATAARFCRENSTSDMRLTFADYDGENARYSRWLLAAAEQQLASDVALGLAAR